MAILDASISEISKPLTNKDEAVRHAGIVRLCKIVSSFEPDEVRQHLTSLVEISKRSLDDTCIEVRTAATMLIVLVAKASTRRDFHVFSPLLEPLWRGMACDNTDIVVSILIALTYIVGLADEDHVRILAGEVLWGIRFVLDQHEMKDRDTMAMVLYILGECVSIKGKEVDSSLNFLLPGFVKKFWTYSSELDPNYSKKLFEVTVEMAKRLGVPTVRRMIANELHGEQLLSPKGYMAGVMEIVDNLFLF